MECLKEGFGLLKGQYWLFLGICALGMIIGGAVPIVLLGPMMCGIFLCFLRRIRGEEVGLDRLFKGFDFFGQSVIAALLQMIPALVIIVPFYLVMFIWIVAAGASGKHGGQAAGGVIVVMVLMYLVIILASMLLGILFAFTFPLVVDRRLSGFDAVMTSVKAAFGNLGGLLGLMLLSGLMSIAGMCCCYVGVFLVLPITMAAMAVAYRRVFPEIPQTPASPPSLPGS